MIAVHCTVWYRCLIIQIISISILVRKIAQRAHLTPSRVVINSITRFSTFSEMDTVLACMNGIFDLEKGR